MPIDRQEILDIFESSALWGEVAVMAREKFENELNEDRSALATTVGTVVDVLLPFGAFEKLPEPVRVAAEAYDGLVAAFLTDLVIDLVTDPERMGRIRAWLKEQGEKVQVWHQANVSRRQERRATRREAKED